jgi:hypothetical protein
MRRREFVVLSIGTVLVAISGPFAAIDAMAQYRMPPRPAPQLAPRPPNEMVPPVLPPPTAGPQNSETVCLESGVCINVPRSKPPPSSPKAEAPPK